MGHWPVALGPAMGRPAVPGSGTMANVRVRPRTADTREVVDDDAGEPALCDRRTGALGRTAGNLLAAAVVTAAGGLVRAGGRGPADLFWALRGGGGNFGGVTSFPFRAIPLGPDGLAGTFICRRERWVEALRGWDAWG